MTKSEKIRSIKELAGMLSHSRADGKKIVQCHGVFDLLHIGHIRYLEQARLMGDILVVTVTPDRYVDKGPHRPAFPENLRAEAIASLNCVDYVAINEWPTAEETLRLLKPHIYVKGSEFKNITADPTGKIAREASVVSEIGAELAFTEDIVFSSSNLINRYLNAFPEEINEYLNLLRQRYTLNEILRVMDAMKNLNVLVIGDTIIDEYQYCEVIGKSSKDPVLAFKYLSHDLFAGGVLAVANHVAQFAGSVKLLTVLGEHDSHEPFIRAELHPNISPRFAIQSNAPTLIKRRFIEGYSFNKLFEIYIMDDSGLSSQKHEEVCDWLKKNISDYDVVIAADFGHGIISSDMISLLAEKSRFLAVNTQANAGNRGFNTITRYPRADYICMAEHEIRLETRDLNKNLRSLMIAVSDKLQCPRIVVTRGRKGATVYSVAADAFVDVPSFAQNVVDRVGAGDAFFSVTSLAASQEVPDELIGFIGNVSGSLAVEIVGNKKAISKSSVEKFITSVMK